MGLCLLIGEFDHFVFDLVGVILAFDLFDVILVLIWWVSVGGRCVRA